MSALNKAKYRPKTTQLGSIMSATTTQTKTAEPQPEIIYIKLKFAQKPLEALIAKLIASNCFDTTQQQDFKDWLESFSKKFPEVPKENAGKSEAVLDLLFLLVAYIRPKFADPQHAVKMVQFQKEIEDILKNYLPAHADLEALIQDYEAEFYEEERYIKKIELIENLFQKTMAEIAELQKSADKQLEEQFEKLKAAIQDLIKDQKNKSIETHARVEELHKKIQGISQAQLLQANEQKKIIAVVGALRRANKTAFQSVQQLKG
jgi:hypothetical protein